MDRQSFINQNSLNNTSRCNSEVCECDEADLLKAGQLKKVEPLHLVGITILAFVCATIFSMVKSEAAKTSFGVQMENIVACSSANIGDQEFNKDPQREDDKNGSGCSHQLTASTFIYINNFKRKKIHDC